MDQIMNFNTLFKTPSLSNKFIKKLVHQIENQSNRRIISLNEALNFSITMSYPSITKQLGWNLDPVFNQYLKNRPIIFENHPIKVKFSEDNTLILNEYTFKTGSVHPIVAEARKVFSLKMANYDSTELNIEIEIKNKKIDPNYFSSIDFKDLEDFLLNEIFKSLSQNNIVTYNHISSIPRSFEYQGNVFKTILLDIKMFLHLVAKEKNLKFLLNYFETLELEFLIEYIYELKNDVPYGTPSKEEQKLLD